MKIKQAQIHGYRSIRGKVDLFIEPNVTVVLGPNDHGKTNLLNALTHLNEENGFTSDDLNWDRNQEAYSLPSVVGVFTLSKQERKQLLDGENLRRQTINKKIVSRQQEETASEVDDEDADSEDSIATSGSLTTSVSSGVVTDDPDEQLEDEDDLPDELLSELSLSQVPTEITVSRCGLKSEATLDDWPDELEYFSDVARGMVPRVELIGAFNRLSDSVTAEGLSSSGHEFMRGIFHYAELDPDNSDHLFEQNDRSEMELTKASETLNQTLRKSWSQGKELKFLLSHDSANKTIELKMKDPAVESTYVRASRRSSGFTHYFSLKTILHARQKDNPASAYLLLFDEPGIFLHPSGQFDLLQVIETLAMESQVAYVTHSLFMINKTYPTRHRLVMKSRKGTVLDGKPYVGRWESVVNALGLNLIGSILFANQVVLTEGDSDPIYLFAILQKAVEAGKSNLDINGLSIMSTSDSKHTDVLVQVLADTRPSPRISLITDGDDGGDDRVTYIKKLIAKHKIEHKRLKEGSAIEDCLPMLKEMFVPAVARYTRKLVELLGARDLTGVDFDEEVAKDYAENYESLNPKPSVIKWAEDVATSIGKLKSKPSKIGIAREYVHALRELHPNDFKLSPQITPLLKWLKEKAGVPEFVPVKEEILE